MAVVAVSWNIAKRYEPWRHLLEMNADVALLQEAGHPPPADVADRIDTGPAGTLGLACLEFCVGGRAGGRICTSVGRWW